MSKNKQRKLVGIICLLGLIAGVTFALGYSFNDNPKEKNNYILTFNKGEVIISYYMGDWIVRFAGDTNPIAFSGDNLADCETWLEQNYSIYLQSMMEA